MDMSSQTTTANAAGATPSAAPMAMSMGGSCKISMLWNWNTIDACFISRSWRITSKGMFAGSCIGVVLLVMSLELLRRGSQEYDRYLIRQHKQKHTRSISEGTENKSPLEPSATSVIPPFRPDISQQAIRATFHTVQFTIAYFVMLLAMYYNGYIIISIIAGAFLGAFFCSWQVLDIGSGRKEEATYCCG